jgi:predicted ATPase
VLSLIEALAGHELDDDGCALAEEITRETAGNPFFAGELLRHLMEAGAIVQEDGGRWHVVGEVAELGLPQSVREVIGRRVERLGSDARRALSAAAVIGSDFDLGVLLAVVDLPQAQLLDLLDEAVAASLLQESSERAGRFTFVHVLVAHTLYEDLGATRRALLHRQVAEALEELCSEAPGERLVAEFSEAIGSAGGSAAILAYHWREAGHLDRTVHYLLMAAEGAGRGRAEAEAVTLYNQALDLIPEDDARRRRDVQLKRAIAYARFTHATVLGDT